MGRQSKQPMKTRSQLAITVTIWHSAAKGLEDTSQNYQCFREWAAMQSRRGNGARFDDRFSDWFLYSCSRPAMTIESVVSRGLIMEVGAVAKGRRTTVSLNLRVFVIERSYKTTQYQELVASNLPMLISISLRLTLTPFDCAGAFGVCWPIRDPEPFDVTPPGVGLRNLTAFATTAVESLLPPPPPRPPPSCVPITLSTRRSRSSSPGDDRSMKTRRNICRRAARHFRGDSAPPPLLGGPPATSAGPSATVLRVVLLLLLLGTGEASARIVSPLPIIVK